MSRAAALLLALAACHGTGGGRGAGPTGPTSRASPPEVALLARVPADASFVIIPDGGPGQAILSRLLDELTGGDLPGAKVAHALVAELFAAPTPGEGGARPSVVYGHGLTPIARLAIDRTAGQAALDRAVAAAHAIADPTVVGRWTLTALPFSSTPVPLWLVVAASDDQLALTVTSAPDTLIPVLTGPPPAQAHPDVAGPGRLALTIAPDRLATALAAAADGPAPAYLADCARTVALLLARTPAVTLTRRPAVGYRLTGRVAVSPTTAARLDHHQVALPAWPSHPAGVVVGVGIPPPELLTLAGPWLEALEGIDAGCEWASPLGSLRQFGAMPPFAQTDALVMWIDGDRIQVVVSSRDLRGLWAGLRAVISTRPLPPAPGEHLTVSGMEIVGGASSLGFSSGGAEQLAALMAAPPGAPAVLSVEVAKGDLWQEWLGSFAGQRLRFDLRMVDGRLHVSLAADPRADAPTAPR